ncbi:MAG TPA: response regulator [Phenylobacterium sp.]
MATILVIDEDPKSVEFIRWALWGQGHHVLEAGGGANVERRFEAQAFDAVLLEVLMEEREGVETILSLKQRWPDRPIVAMTAGGAMVSVTSALTLAKAVGADAILPKPFSATDLSLAVEQAMTKCPSRAGPGE